MPRRAERAGPCQSGPPSLSGPWRGTVVSSQGVPSTGLVWAGLTGASPRKGHRDDQGIGASVVRGETERAEHAQLGEQRAQGDLIHVSGYPMGGYPEKREALGSGAQGQDKRQQALTETHKIPVNRRKWFFTMKLAKEELGSLYPWSFSNPADECWAAWSSWPCLSRSLDWSHLQELCPS